MPNQPTIEFVLNTGQSGEEIKDLLEPLFDDGRLDVEEIPFSDTTLEEIPKVKRLGEILIERGEISTDDLQKALRQQKRLGEKLIEEGLVTPEIIDDAIKEQNRQKDLRLKSLRTDISSSIRVSSFKLDRLVNLIGELVTVQERLSQVTSSLREARAENVLDTLRNSNLSAISEEVSRLTNGLRDNTLSIRMLPVEATFSKFRRLVHDLATSLGKEIELTMSGAETEIDKTVIDKIDEPLMHLIRNSVDHGIETPEVRIAAGKPRKGTIHLSAAHSGGNVVINVGDDGAGLNKERIRQKAIEKKLIPADAELSDKDIFSLIFLPGFSTAKEVTNVSGRGVGMDVVKKNIEDLRGNVTVFSNPDSGTQIQITLPLTLAIIDGLLVTIGTQAFIFPLAAVEECVEIRRDKNNLHGDKGLTNVRGKLVPYISLRERFQIAGDPPPIEQIAITSIDNQRVGFLVDTVVGEHKTVIKPLGKVFRDISEFSGATILGDGSIAIIMDISRMLKYHEETE